MSNNQLSHALLALYCMLAAGCITLATLSERYLSPAEMAASDKEKMPQAEALKIFNETWAYYYALAGNPEVFLAPPLRGSVVADPRGFRLQESFTSRASSPGVDRTTTTTQYSADYYIPWEKVTSAAAHQTKVVRDKYEDASVYTLTLKYNARVNDEPAERPLQLTLVYDPNIPRSKWPHPLASVVKAYAALAGPGKMLEPDAGQKEFKPTKILPRVSGYNGIGERF